MYLSRVDPARFADPLPAQISGTIYRRIYAGQHWDGKYITNVAVEGGDYYIVIFNNGTKSTTNVSSAIE